MIYTNELNKEVLERHNMNKADEHFLGGFVGRTIEELFKISPSISVKLFMDVLKIKHPMK